MALENVTLCASCRKPVHSPFQKCGDSRLMSLLTHSEATIKLTLRLEAAPVFIVSGGLTFGRSCHLLAMPPGHESSFRLSSFAVRLCSDRVGLIKECICQAPTCYKQAAKLLGLAELLRVAGKCGMLNRRVRCLCDLLIPGERQNACLRVAA